MSTTRPPACFPITATAANKTDNKAPHRAALLLHRLLPTDKHPLFPVFRNRRMRRWQTSPEIQEKTRHRPFDFFQNMPNTG